MSDGSTSEKPSLAEKVAYGLGDTACNLVWALGFNFALYFYTDVFRIPAAAGEGFCWRRGRSMVGST